MIVFVDAQMPESFNWFNVSDVKHPAENQGACGCCWAFAAVSALEMQSVLEGNPFIYLSKQQAVDWFVPHSNLPPSLVLAVCFH